MTAPSSEAVGVGNAIHGAVVQQPRHHPTWSEVKAAYGEQLERLTAICVIENELQ